MAPTAGTVTACRYDDPFRDGWRRITLLAHERYCDEVINQTDLLRKVVEGADLSVTVPTTPDWNLAQLLRHIGGNLRASEAAVRTGTAIVEPAKQVPEVAGPATDDPDALDAWLAEGAARWAETLRRAGPDVRTQIWVFTELTGFWARRAALDLVVHRADAAGAVKADYAVAPELAADAVDELLELISVPPSRRSPRRPGVPRGARCGTRCGRRRHSGAEGQGARDPRRRQAPGRMSSSLKRRKLGVRDLRDG